MKNKGQTTKNQENYEKLMKIYEKPLNNYQKQMKSYEKLKITMFQGPTSHRSLLNRVLKTLKYIEKLVKRNMKQSSGRCRGHQGRRGIRLKTMKIIE